ncbi:flagellar hook-associated protein 3 [Enterobacteriaceae bacterium RIT692]|nr:flagellar hook-associated protein 3 [Enterobacteriaceae bacterium RIT692]
MRINSSSFSTTMLNSINRNTVQMNKLMSQISAQKRILTPSDDPIASTQIVQMRREQAVTGQYQTNIERLTHSLRQQETLVDSTSTQLLGMLDKLREANNSSNSKADMAGYAAELVSMKEALVERLNGKDESGRYLFAGTKTNEKPFVRDAATGEWVYAGNQNSNYTPVGNGSEMRSNTDLATAFGGNLETLNDLEDLLTKMSDPALSHDDYADDLTAMLKQMQSTSDNVAAVLTDIGGRQNNLTSLQDAHTDLQILNEEMLDGLQGLDFAKAFTDLSRYSTATQATYQTYQQIANLSLFSLR